jgi:hypothetical protein
LHPRFSRDNSEFADIADIADITEAAADVRFSTGPLPLPLPPEPHSGYAARPQPARSGSSDGGSWIQNSQPHRSSPSHFHDKNCPRNSPMPHSTRHSTRQIQKTHRSRGTRRNFATMTGNEVSDPNPNPNLTDVCNHKSDPNLQFVVVRRAD